MFPGEIEEDLVLILTKNNFDLKKLVYEVSCSTAGASNKSFKLPNTEF